MTASLPARDFVKHLGCLTVGVLLHSLVYADTADMSSSNTRPTVLSVSSQSLSVEAGTSDDTAVPPRTSGVLPDEELFEPLIADPRWPRFSASLLFFEGDEELGTVGSANFGASFPFYGWQGLGGQWQLGLQAGVFSIFDLEAPSLDLVNSDFLVGLPLSARYGWISTQIAIFHQSSHLGDEFLLRNRIDRVNLSYEAIDILLSADVQEWLRIYGGGSRIVNSEPDGFGKYGIQAGFEITSSSSVLSPLLYPVAAFDFQAEEESDWDGNFSLRTGFEVRSERFLDRRLQILFEYFNGPSPNGQFFDRIIQYYGAGLHFYF